MMANPHVLIEGVAISSFAIGCEHAFIYLRGEVVHVYRRLLRAVEEASRAGHLGDERPRHRASTSTSPCTPVPAPTSAARRRRCSTRSRAAAASRASSRRSPRVAGLYARPTSVNNVESIASVPGIILEGSDWFKGMGTEKSTGFGIFSLSGHVTNPGQFEAPLGITMRELIELAGGMRERPRAEVLDAGRLLDADLHRPSTSTCRSTSTRSAAAGSMLGTRALQVFDETVSVVRAVAAGPTSTPTSPAASARRAARARGGCARS